MHQKKFLDLKCAGIALGLTLAAVSAMAADHEYKASKANIEADYEAAKMRCEAKMGDEKDLCFKEAKASYEKARADAKAEHKTSEVKQDAHQKKMDADYKVAKARCESMTGAEKDACIQNAKVQYKQ